MTRRDNITFKRILTVGILLALWAVVIVWRLVDLQVLQHREFCKKAVAQQERIKVIPAIRGSIFDRNGELLAVTRKADTVAIEPARVTNAYRTASVLSAVLSLDRQKILKTCRRDDFSSIFIKRMVPAEMSNHIRQLGLDGVELVPENDRHYPQGMLACHLLGFTNLVNEGCYGVEGKFNEKIKGEKGEWLVYRDARGQTYGPAKRPATAGCDLVLTIDEVIQFHTERALDRAMEQSRAATGSVVVMDIWNGDILAMANRPGFDPNNYGEFGLDRMSNLSIHQIYEPGSTFKLITMAAALEAGLVDLERKIDCGRGKLLVDGSWIHDHKSFDMLTPAEIIAYSSNVGAMKLGMSAGNERLHRMISAFGFGRKTGIQLQMEEPGLVKPVKSWSGRTCATISFGQEVSVTPLQLCRAMAAIAADGMLRVPRLVLRIEGQDGDLLQRYPTKIEGRAVSEETAAVLREMMAGVVAYGTASKTATGNRAASDHYQTAGKTGTAQMIVDGAYSDTRFVASFAGFAPLQRPRIAVAVVLGDVRRPHHHGGQTAAPVFREVVDRALHRLAVPSSQDVVLRAAIRRLPAREDG